MSDTYFDLPSRLEDSFSDIESDIIMDLRNNNEEYAALHNKISGMKQQDPFIDKVMNGSGEIHLTEEEHAAFAEYLHCLFKLADLERLQVYFRGYTVAVAYLKKSMRSDSPARDPCLFSYKPVGFLMKSAGFFYI